MIETHDGEATVFKADGVDDLDFVRSKCLITSVRVTPRFEHEEVTIFSRGGCSGIIVVKSGDGARIAQRLLTPAGPLVLPATEGVEQIAVERKRQIEIEGWDSLHDDQHDGGEIAGAAASYASIACRQVAEGIRDVSAFPPGQLWRWSSGWWKPSNDPIRNLVKAGALIAAEIDRLVRARQ